MLKQCSESALKGWWGYQERATGTPNGTRFCSIVGRGTVDWKSSIRDKSDTGSSSLAGVG